MPTWSEKQTTLNNQDLITRFADIEELERRAGRRAEERQQRRKQAEEDKDFYKFFVTVAAFAGAAVVAGVGLQHYNKIHEGQPIHGPAVPVKTDSPRRP